MARPTLEDLLRRLRRVIGDPAGADQVFSDDDLQEALDAHREDVRYLPLRGEVTRIPGGADVYRTWVADRGDWEADAELTDRGGHVLTAATADYQVGRWTLASEPSAPVFLTGRTYDLQAAAADLLEAWAARVKLDFSFSPGSGGGQFQRAQKHAMLLEQAERCRRRVRPQVCRVYRSDVNA